MNLDNDFAEQDTDADSNEGEVDDAADCEILNDFHFQSETPEDVNDTRLLDPYKPQGDLVFNKLLPYYDLIDDEAKHSLSRIKGNLLQAVLLRELKDGCYYWTLQLSTYIRNYGLNMSKSDHLALIRLLYELTTIEDLEFSLVHHFARVLKELLKKRHLISREDLILPWRPLYKVYTFISLHRLKKVRMVRVSPEVDFAIKSLIRVARIYFPIESTTEMLAEWRPWLCPFVRSQTKKAMQCFELFLPVAAMNLQEHDLSFRLWFDEFMQMWLSCHGNPSWESDFVALFARLARENVGFIDWNPYVPTIFTRLLRSFQLPVTMKKIHLQGVKEIYDINTISLFVVMLLGGRSVCQGHLTQLFKTLQSFYHPSNNGSWNSPLKQLLSGLSLAFLLRLRREQVISKSCLPVTPKEYCLKDEDVTAFVTCLRPCVLMSIFSKSGCKHAALALKHLSFLRPELIVPLVLDKFNPSIATLTEPHRLVAVLQCLTHVSAALVGGSSKEGTHTFDAREYILPVLNGCLPAIDPNDINKSLSAFQLLSCLLCHVPLVDFSRLVVDHPELTKKDRDLCLSTCQFEDFVLRFLDRCFFLIENTSAEQALTLNSLHINDEEDLLHRGMRAVLRAIFTHCSTVIFQVAVLKVRDFVLGRIMNIKNAGYISAKLLREIVQHGDGCSFELFLPGICRAIEDNLSDISLECKSFLQSNPGNELLYNMLLFQEMMCCDGRVLVKHRFKITSTLKKLVLLTDKDGHSIACKTFKNLLERLTQVYCSDYEGKNSAREDNRNGILPDLICFQDWACTVDLHDVKVAWHLVNQEELEFSQDLVDIFLTNELSRLKNFSEEHLIMSSEELQQSVVFVYSILLGCLGLSPLWDTDKVPFFESSVDTKLYQIAVNVKSSGTLTLFVGKNLRKEVAAIIRQLNHFILEKHEDNTVALIHIVKIYFILMFYWGTEHEMHIYEWKGWLAVKKLLENPLLGKKRHLRTVVIQRASLQHRSRLAQLGLNVFTELHRLLMSDLLKLSISYYAEVRLHSQEVLNTCFRLLPWSCNSMLPEIGALVNSTSNLEHHALKGFLYTLLGMPSFSLLTKRDWQVVSTIWPVVIKTPPTDKPSINALMDKIAEKINKQYETFAINVNVSLECFTCARNLWSSVSRATPLCPQPLMEEFVKVECLAFERNVAALRLYEDIVKNFVKLLEESSNLHWQNYQLGLELLAHLVRHDVVLPGSETTAILMQGLVSDYVVARRASMFAIVRILQQLKPPVPYLTVKVHEVAGDSGSDLFYDDEKVPTTAEKWNTTYFIDKPNIGFYRWPLELRVHAPCGQLPNRFKLRDDFGDVEGEIYNFFAAPSYVERLITHLSAEGNADHGRFNITRCYLFKHLFRNYGSMHLDIFKPHIKRLLNSTRDCHRRCALEIIVGLVAGSKHWTYDMLMEMWDFVVPVLRDGLTCVNTETQIDWNRAVSFMMCNRDPRRMKWLLDLLMENLFVSTDGSFLEANRISLLVVALNEQPWRNSSILCRIMDNIRPHLANPYQNIRNELGRLLSQVFITDVALPPFEIDRQGPSQHLFVDVVLSQLQSFKKTFVLGSTSTITQSANDPNSSCYDDSPLWKTSATLLKTVCRWLQQRILKSHQWTSVDIFKFFPILCLGEGCDSDQELQVNCRVSIAIMAHSFLSPDHVDSALDVVDQVCNSDSWRSRRICIEYLQVLIFSNLFVLLGHPECLIRVRNMVLLLLQDSKPEVQQVAALALSGMFHSEIMKSDSDILGKFKVLCAIPIKKRRQGRLFKAEDDNLDIPPDALQHRHAGILGLCAFVGAHPYDIADDMPNVLIMLGDHLHDPQPLQGTVRQTLTNFWRTHRDNWHDHKLKFTDDQLSILTDLLVSPNYYA